MRRVKKINNIHCCKVEMGEDSLSSHCRGLDPRIFRCFRPVWMTQLHSTNNMGVILCDATTCLK